MHEQGKALRDGRSLWPMCIDTSGADPLAARKYPLAPDAFDERLRSKTFTNNADCGAVTTLYKNLAVGVLGSAKRIDLMHVPVLEGDGALLAQALAMCECVEDLHLGGEMRIRCARHLSLWRN